MGRTVPQPNMAVPGTGALTFTFLGEAGVCGRAAMLGGSLLLSRVLAQLSMMMTQYPSSCALCRGLFAPPLVSSKLRRSLWGPANKREGPAGTKRAVQPIDLGLRPACSILEAEQDSAGLSLAIKIGQQSSEPSGRRAQVEVRQAPQVGGERCSWLLEGGRGGVQAQ